MHENEKICPICGSDQLQVLYRFSPEDVAHHLVLEEKEAKYKDILTQVEQLWNQKFCEVLACSDCNFEFAWPFVSGDKLFYSTVYDQEISYPDWKWEYERSFDFIDNLVQNKNTGLRLLEIGAGNGTFLKRVGDSLLRKENMIATEFSEKGVESILQHGIQCCRKSIHELEEEKLIPPCDIICMFQVLEHMSDIKNTFSALNSMAKENAFLIIAVPNPIQRKYFDLKKIYLDIPPIHIGRYYRKTFETLGEEYNWRIIDYALQPQSFKEKVLKFVFDRYNRAKYADRVDSRKNKLLKKLTKYAYLTSILMSHFKIIIHLRSDHMGTSQWIIMQKLPSVQDH